LLDRIKASPITNLTTTSAHTHTLLNERIREEEVSRDPRNFTKECTRATLYDKRKKTEQKDLLFLFFGTFHELPNDRYAAA
jgi:hypothetical protein